MAARYGGIHLDRTAARQAVDEAIGELESLDESLLEPLGAEPDTASGAQQPLSAWRSLAVTSRPFFKRPTTGIPPILLHPILPVQVEADPLRCPSPLDPSTFLTEEQSIEATPTDVASWAQIYHDRGYAVVPVPADKRPLAAGWSTQPPELAEFQPGDNIGILTGPLSGNLVCVDIDSARAIELADQFLPQTAMIEGRASKIDSHRYFIAINVTEDLTAPSTSASGKALGGPKTRRYFAKKPEGGTGECVVELRGTGQQAVAPPSRHGSSGERRVWTEFGAPAVIDAKELYAAVDALAVACGCASRWQPAVAAVPRRQRLDHSGRGVAERHEFDDLPSLANRVERARAYLAKLDEAVSGEGGQDQTFYAACLLVRDFALEREAAWELLLEYNERCDPEWTEEELEHKLEDADRFEGRRGSKLVALTVEETVDPHRLAAAYLDTLGSTDALAHCRFWRNEWWHWTGTRYRCIPDGDFEPKLNKAVREEVLRAHQAESQRAQAAFQRAQAAWPENAFTPAQPPKKTKLPPVTMTLVANTKQALQGMTLLDAQVEQPSWLLDDAHGERRPYLALQNGLLDVGAYLATGANQVRPHTPQWFSPVCLPYAWNAAAASPRWQKALGLTFGGDAERIALLQEWFGYCLQPSTDLQKFLLLVGEGQNGKSVICAALTALLGTDNVSHVRLEDFGGAFDLHTTLGKLANIVAEIGELDRTAEGKLKAFVSGDSMTFNRKYLVPVAAVPTARLTFATNNLPRFSDRSDGIWRRLLLVPCDVKIAQVDRVAGMDKPQWWVESDELPGMLRWALAGLQRLQSQGRFTEPAACHEALGAMQLDSNPARAFLLEHYEVGDVRAFVAVEDVYLDYLSSCQKFGYKPLGKENFGKEVGRTFPTIQHGQKRVNGRRPTVYHGLRRVS